MNDRAATIEAEGVLAGSDAAPAAAAAADRAGRGGSMKFLYASGSRPLEGYTIKRGIGRGGFGEVYFATSDAGKEVALKHVERNLEVELRGVGQCLNLKHLNLVDLFDIRYDEQGEAWVVMEYVSGSSLKDVVDRNPNGLPLDEVINWFRGIAAGVAYLHDHGIVHRDLKPGNIFDDDGVVKIGDYGLSKFISCSRRSGQTESVGTFHYMAPEIGKGVYGKEIDVYALGIMLYEMLSGRLPFEGESSQEIIMKHLTAYPELSVVAPQYRNVIARALQKDPEKRFRSVSEMLAAFEFSLANPQAARDEKPASAPRIPPKKLPKSEPLYIADDERDMQFGPLQQVVTATIVTSPFAPARHSPKEPVARVFHAANGLSQWWRAVAWPLKAILLALVVIVLLGASTRAFRIISPGYFLPPVIAIVSAGFVFLGIRQLCRLANVPPKSTLPPLPLGEGRREGIAQYRSPGWQTLSWEQQGRAALRMKTWGDRISELSGSMLMAAAISAILTVVIMVIGQSEWLEHAPAQMAGPAWLWLTITLGAWFILAAGKFWETSACDKHSGDRMKRRFVLLVLGLAFAALAFAMHRFLMVDALHDNLVVRGISPGRYSSVMYASDGAPRLPAYLAYFGAIFVTLGWWKLTDPLRTSRLAIGSVIVALLAAWVWQLIWPFPQPVGFLLVAAISIAVQLSAPWVTPAEKAAIRARHRAH